MSRYVMNAIGITLGLSFLWSFLVALFAVPSIIYIAHLKNMLDTPNVRTVHESLTPRLGGVAVFAGFMSALTIFADLNNGVQQLLAGCIVLFFVGLKDDLVSISVTKKFVGQLLATGIVMVMADVRITSFQGILGIHELPIGISYAFTFLVIVGITNAINLIDGLDGLAGTIVSIIVTTFGYFFYRYGGSEFGNYVYVSVCVLGAFWASSATTFTGLPFLWAILVRWYAASSSLFSQSSLLRWVPNWVSHSGPQPHQWPSESCSCPSLIRFGFS
nr:MraY family glycosyltransferase [Hymenobacter qilianensis]